MSGLIYSSSELYDDSFLPEMHEEIEQQALNRAPPLPSSDSSKPPLPSGPSSIVNSSALVQPSYPASFTCHPSPTATSILNIPPPPVPVDNPSTFSSSSSRKRPRFSSLSVPPSSTIEPTPSPTKSSFTSKPQGRNLQTYTPSASPSLEPSTSRQQQVERSASPSQGFSSLESTTDSASIEDDFCGEEAREIWTQARMAEEEEIESDEEDVPDVTTPALNKTRTKKMKEPKKPHIDFTLPPLSSPEEIFADMLLPHLQSIAQLAIALDERPLRIGTICSGSDSPVFAVELIQEIVQQELVRQGSTVSFNIEHTFSCENVPFKQEFIRKNCHPEFIFKDAIEMGNGTGKATLVSEGDPVDVPSVDLLIAGPSCKDFSPLNANPKPIHDDGQSGMTWRAVLGYVQKFRPAVLIVENVARAPWKTMVKYLRLDNYWTDWTTLNANQFYLPVNRTRGYLVAVAGSLSVSANPQRLELAEKAIRRVKKLQHRPTVPVDAFALPRREAVSEEEKADERDWSKGAIDHAAFRKKERLGNEHPFEQDPRRTTEEFRRRPDRQVEAAELYILELAREGVDLTSKSASFNLSPSLDRRPKISMARLGIAPCITPKSQIYDTSIGEIISPERLLALQGLPVARLELSSLKKNQLVDLAGNAMACPVVGAVVVAVLTILADQPDLLVSRSRSRSRPTSVSTPTHLKIISTLAQLKDQSSSSRVSSLAVGQLVGVVRQHLANGSIEEAERYLREAVPARFWFSGIDEPTLDSSREGIGIQVDEEGWSTLKDRLVELGANEFRLVKIAGGVVEMESTNWMVLRLDLTDPEPSWMLFLKRIASHPQQFFDLPVARGHLVLSSSSLLDTSFAVRIPVVHSFNVSIQGQGFIKPSWRSELGLEDFKDERIWTELEIGSDDATGASLSGQYALTDRGTTQSTYQLARDQQPTIFFKFSTSRFGPPSEDACAFSLQPDPRSYGQPSLHLAVLDPTYRPIHPNAPTVVKASISSRWTFVEGVGIVESRKPNVSLISRAPKGDFDAFPVFRFALDVEEAGGSLAPWRYSSLVLSGLDETKAIGWILDHLPCDNIDFNGDVPTATPPLGTHPFVFRSKAHRLYELLLIPSILPNTSLPRLLGSQPPSSNSPPSTTLLKWSLSKDSRRRQDRSSFKVPNLVVEPSTDAMASWARTGSFFTEKEVSEITFLPLHLQARGEASRLAHRRGGIVVGGGIFDLVLQLLSTPPASPLPSTPPGSSNVVPTHFNSPATLLIVPSADFAGWTSRIKGKSLAFLQAASKLSVEEFTAASLVVVSENVFSSKGYLDNLAKLSSSPSLNVKAENIKSGTLKEALKRLGELVGWLDSGKLLDGPPDLGEEALVDEKWGFLDNAVVSDPLQAKEMPLHAFHWSSVVLASKTTKPFVELAVSLLSSDSKLIFRDASAVKDMASIKSTARLFNIHLQTPISLPPEHRLPYQSVVSDLPSVYLLNSQQQHYQDFLKAFVRGNDAPEEKEVKPKVAKKSMKTPAREKETGLSVSGPSKKRKEDQGNSRELGWRESRGGWDEFDRCCWTFDEEEEEEGGA